MKFIKRVGLSVVSMGLFAGLAIMMANHFGQIAKPIGLDREAVMLAEIKKALPPNSKTSFATNISEDEFSQGAYYQTQFGWCPMALSDDASLNDNIIFYKSTMAKDSSMSFQSLCDTLYQEAGDGYALMLLHKRKSK